MFLVVKVEDVIFVVFGGKLWKVVVLCGISVLKVVDLFGEVINYMDILVVVCDNFMCDYICVVIVIDEQFWLGYFVLYDGCGWSNGEVKIDDLILQEVLVYVWNMVGYLVFILDNCSLNRYSFGGLLDVSFKFIKLLEDCKNVLWLWMI